MRCVYIQKGKVRLTFVSENGKEATILFSTTRLPKMGDTLSEKCGYALVQSERTPGFAISLVTSSSVTLVDCLFVFLLPI